MEKVFECWTLEIQGRHSEIEAENVEDPSQLADAYLRQATALELSNQRSTYARILCELDLCQPLLFSAFADGSSEVCEVGHSSSILHKMLFFTKII